MSLYGDDRVFVYFSLAGDDNDDLDVFFKAVGEAGHPTVRIELDSKPDLGREMPE